MKQLLFILCLISICGCSSDDGSAKEIIIPEKFDIKIEIKGKYEIPEAIIFINSFGVKEWNHFNLPFTGEYTYHTTGNEVSSTACKCITISAWAYIGKTNQMEVFNLYIDGKLVDSETITPNPNSDGTLKPTIVEFTYNP